MSKLDIKELIIIIKLMSKLDLKLIIIIQFSTKNETLLRYSNQLF
jgi:hypothetical protein